VSLYDNRADAARFAALITSIPKEVGFVISRPVQIIDGPEMVNTYQAKVVMPGIGGTSEAYGNSIFEAFARAYADALTDAGDKLRAHADPNHGCQSTKDPL